jgi:uncharacterized membrane protein YeaQ/YmgE (transglycosylase-associated protein family)
MEVKAIIVGAIIGAIAGYMMGSGAAAKGGSTISNILQRRGVVR